MTRWRLCSVALVAVTALALLAGSAAAVGNAALSKHIVTDPLPDGVTAPVANTQAYVNYIEGLEKSAAGSQDVTAQVAAQSWNRAGNKQIFVTITLVAIKQQGLSVKDTNIQTALAAKAGAASFCPGATGSAAFINKSVGDIPNSHYVVCDAVKGVIPETIVMSRANVFGFVETTTKSMSAARLEAVTLAQYNALPTTQSSTTSSSAAALIIAIAIGVVVITGILVAIFVFRARRLRLKTAQVAAVGGPPPGWYVDPLNAQQQRYWNGTAWGPSTAEAAPGTEGTPVPDGSEPAPVAASSYPPPQAAPADLPPPPPPSSDAWPPPVSPEPAAPAEAPEPETETSEPSP